MYLMNAWTDGWMDGQTDRGRGAAGFDLRARVQSMMWKFCLSLAGG